MPIDSDLSINVSKFMTESISEQTAKHNEYLIDLAKNGPTWWEVGPAKYREMRENGETQFPKPTIIEAGQNISLPSREQGRDVPCRLMLPVSGKPKAVIMHIHGGGWVLSSEKSIDPLLKGIADAANVVMISIGYRLAPEHPFPAGPEDCFDAAEWLVDNAEARYGAPLKIIGGESAGGHLTALSTFHLQKTRPNFHLRGLLFTFGVFDLSLLPQTKIFSKKLVLTPEIMTRFVDACCPGFSCEQLKEPSISPFYQDLKGMKLPSALFTCGTEDPLLEDTMMMALRWQMTGTEGIVKIFPGAPHGFIAYSQQLDLAKECLHVILEYIVDKVS